MELSSSHTPRGGSFLTPSPAGAGRKRRESRNHHDPAGVSSIIELIDPSSPTSSGPAFDELRSFFLRTQPSAASVSRQLDHDFQKKAKLVHDRLISLVDDADSPGTWATFLLKWCVGLLGALEAKLAGAVGQQTSIEAHLGRLHNLYLASVITRCLAALQTDEPNRDDAAAAAKKREELDGAEPLAWLFQSAARGPRTLEWLVAFVGLHRPREVMDHLLASIFRDVVEGRATSHPLSASSSSTTSSSASSSSLSPACFGVHAIEYLAQRHPQHCVDALRAHWARFLRYSAADHAKGDTHLLGLFALVASACPTATQLALPLVLGSLSMATLDRVITREADLPSHRPGNMSLLDLISQVLVAHLPHLGPNAWQLVLLLEALRRKTQFVAAADDSLSHSSLLSRLLQDEGAAKGDVKMEVEGGEGSAVALPNQALIAAGAETLLARTLLVMQDALFDALSSSGLRDRYLDHSLSNDGKSGGRLSFLYHLRQHIGPLVSLALPSQTTQGDADAGSLFELLLVLIGVEGGQKSAGDVLHHLFIAADHRQPPARSLSLFLRVRSRFLNYYPDVYRVCVQRVVESMAALADDRLVAVLANFCFLLRADEAAASPPAPQPSLQLSTAALLADHWAQLFGLLYRPALGSAASAVAAPLPPVLFPLLEATVAHLAAEGDATLFHTCIEQVLLYFLALLPSTPPATTTTLVTTATATATATATTTTTTATAGSGTSAATDAIPPVEAVKRLIVKMTDAAPQSALPHILDLLFDFIFSPEADGIVRRKREVIRATKPSRPSPTVVAGSSTPPVLPAPVSKSVYVPPANAIFQPTTSFFSALPLFSHSHPSSLFLAPSSTTHASSSPPASSSSLSSSSSFLSSPAQLRAEPGAAAGTSLLEQNLKRRAHDRKDSRTSLSIFEKTLIKKRKLGFDADSSHYQDKVLLEAMLLQDNQRHIIDLLSLCVHHNDVERLGVLADLYLARLMRTQDPTPTYEQYKEVLPRRPTFARDQFVQKIFTQNAILVPLLELIAREPSILYRCLEVIRSLMVYTISHWHAEIAPQPKTSTEFSFTCRLLELLRSAKWVPAPLCYCGEIMGEITPEEITTILLAVWDFLHHSPPSPNHYFVSTYEPKYPQEGDEDKRQPVACNVDPFMRTLRNVLRQNVGKVSLNYARFF